MQKGFVRKHIGNSHWSIPNKCYYVGFRYSKHAIKSTRETLAERYFEYHCQIKWVRNLVRDMLRGGFSKRNDTITTTIIRSTFYIAFINLCWGQNIFTIKRQGHWDNFKQPLYI